MPRNEQLNLQRGLEGWYEIGTDYFNEAYDTVEDKSGYGRHLVGKGGTVVNDFGYGSFGSVTFDGSEDHLQVNTNGISAEVITGAVLFNLKDDSGNCEVYGRGGHYRIKTNQNSTSWWTQDGNGNVVEIIVNTTADWQMAIASYNTNTDERRLDVYDYGNGELKTVEGENTTSADTFLADTVGGGYSNTSSLFTGKISFFAQWSRELSRSERQYLGNLTGPRRSML